MHSMEEKIYNLINKQKKNNTDENRQFFFLFQMENAIVEPKMILHFQQINLIHEKLTGHTVDFGIKTK